MATATMSKKSQIMEFLNTGRGLTASEASKMFGVRNFRATISNIKETVERYGNWRIVTSNTNSGETRYSMKRVRLVGPSNYSVGGR
jgi:hypothetical protein